MGRGQTETRMLAAQKAVDEVQGVVVAADGQQGAFHLLAGAQQLHLHGLVTADALAVAGHADDAVGTAQAGDGARAARQGHGKEGVVHPAQLDADAFFHAGAGGQRVDGQGRDRFAAGQAALLEQGQQGLDELFQGHDGRDGIARRTDDGHPAHHAEGRGLAGHDGHAVGQQLALAGDDVGGIVVAARRGTGVEQHQIRALVDGRVDGRADGFGIVGHDGQGKGLAPGLLHDGREDVGIELRQAAARAQVFLAGLGEGHDLCPAGDDAHAGLCEHQRFQHAARGQRAQLVGADADAGRQNDLGRHHVLAQLAHMLPGEGGLLDDHMLSVGLGVDVLHHDHGIGARGQGMAGIDPEGVGADGQAQGPPGGGGEGGFGVDGDAVHGRAVEGRGGAARGHGLGQHAVQGSRQGHMLRGQFAALGADAVQPALTGGLHGLQSQIGMTFALHKYLPISRMEAGKILCGRHRFK